MLSALLPLELSQVKSEVYFALSTYYSAEVSAKPQSSCQQPASVEVLRALRRLMGGSYFLLFFRGGLIAKFLPCDIVEPP